jgi:hypothetical protein
MTEAVNSISQKSHQLSFIDPPKEDPKPQTFRQKQVSLRKSRVANRKRLKKLPFTEAEESVRY